MSVFDDVFAPPQGAEGFKIAILHPKSTSGILVELCEKKLIITYFFNFFFNILGTSMCPLVCIFNHSFILIGKNK